MEDPVSYQLTSLEKVRYWEAILEKLQERLTQAALRQMYMAAFLKKFRGDPRTLKLIPIYRSQCALVAALVEQTDVAFEELDRADLEVNVMWE